jgi:hypothetical protein
VNKRSWKFGGGVSTPTLPSRVLMTAAVLALGAMLGVKIVREVGLAQTQVAAFVFFLLGVWLLGALVLVPHLWRPSGEWKRSQYERHRLERRLADALKPTRRLDPALTRALTAFCPVCGQVGPTVVRSRSRCTACQRPWQAGQAGRAAPAAVPPAVIDLRDRVSTRASG